jgi:hypothetical protein
VGQQVHKPPLQDAEQDKTETLVWPETLKFLCPAAWLWLCVLSTTILSPPVMTWPLPTACRYETLEHFSTSDPITQSLSAKCSPGAKRPQDFVVHETRHDFALCKF